MKYDIQIQNVDGNAITSLPLTRYGKSPLKFLIQDEDGLKKAVNQAYSDAGAKLALEFESHPKIKQ